MDPSPSGNARESAASHGPTSTASLRRVFAAEFAPARVVLTDVNAATPLLPPESGDFVSLKLLYIPQRTEQGLRIAPVARIDESPDVV